MAIKEITLNDTKHFEVSINVRSKINPRFRAQRKRKDIPTLKEAQKIEKELLSECAREVGKLEVPNRNND